MTVDDLYYKTLIECAADKGETLMGYMGKQPITLICKDLAQKLYDKGFRLRKLKDKGPRAKKSLKTTKTGEK